MILQKNSTKANFDWYLCKDFITMNENVFLPLSDRGWRNQGATPYYNSNGKLKNYDQVFTKSQYTDKLETTIKLAIYSWKEEILF